jgi:hypothetical protein
MNDLKVKFYYKLNFKFDYRVLSRRLKIKTFTEAITRRSKTIPCPRYSDLRNNSRREGEERENTSAK